MAIFSIESILPKQHELKEMAVVVTKAMLTNPLHLAVFGAADKTAEERQVKLFTTVLRQPACNLFVARDNNRIVAVMNYYKAGCCQLSPLKTISLLPGLSLSLRGKLPRVLRWKMAWGKHDPKLPHFHFGPLAVLPEMQGKGIGTSLLVQFCELADRHSIASYLETDKEENITLYQKSGFKVIAEDRLFGVNNWFMLRQPPVAFK